jgi:hypothetical protein
MLPARTRLPVWMQVLAGDGNHPATEITKTGVNGNGP